MSSSSVRAFPPAAALAAIGGAAGLLALLLPWFTFNPEGLLQLARALGIDTAVAQAQGVSAAQLQQQLATQLQGMQSVGANELVGYRVFSPITVAIQAIAGAGGIWAALRMLGGAQPSSMSGSLIGGGLLIGGRAVYGLTRIPGADELKTLGVQQQLLTPAIGLWVALGAGVALLAAAALAAKQGSAEASTDWIAPAGGIPGNAHVPGGMTSAMPAGYMPSAPQAQAAPASYMPSAPQAPAAPARSMPPAPQAQATAGPAMPRAHAAAPPAGPHVPMPSQYAPSGGYGAEGPGTLDRDSRLVRPNDPYAPAPRTAPAVPIMPAPANVMPINDPAPIAEAPGAVYGVPPRPAPAPSEQHAPPRSGSTAPPGFAA